MYIALAFAAPREFVSFQNDDRLSEKGVTSMRLILMTWLMLSAVASVAVLSACVAAGRADDAWRRALQKQSGDPVASRVPVCKTRSRPLDIWRERCRQRYAKSSIPVPVRVTPSQRPILNYPRR